MKSQELGARMRVFETVDDHCLLPEVFVVVRLDGRGFTRQTKEVWKLEAPFDVRFRDLMRVWCFTNTLNDVRVFCPDAALLGVAIALL